MSDAITFKWKKIDLATGRMSEMVEFYTNTFAIEFKAIPVGEASLYCGRLGELEMLLAPKELSGHKPDDTGVHQFHLVVSDLSVVRQQCAGHGHAIEESSFGDGKEAFCVRDPDGNPLILIQE